MLIASISQLAKNYMITQSCMYLPYQISKVVSLYTSIQIFINTTGTGREGGAWLLRNGTRTFSSRDLLGIFP